MGSYLHVLEYIKLNLSELGCQIAIKDFVGFTAKDPDVADLMNSYFIHKSSFCMYMKSNREMWVRCQNTTKLLFERCRTCDSYFVGTCYCGFGEMVIPVKYNGKVIAAICIYGFEPDAKCSARRINKAVKRYGIDGEKAMRFYRESVKKDIIDYNNIFVRFGILADFLRMNYKFLVYSGKVTPYTVYTADTKRDYILSNAIEYIRMNYADDIHVRDIADFCRCSESYINHNFKKKMNLSVSQFINHVRIDKAKELIAETSGSFNEISDKCGFSDPNYFSLVFKKLMGLSPSEYKTGMKEGKVLI